MKFKVPGIFLLMLAMLSACGEPSATSTTSKPAATATPVPTPFVPKNGDYDAKGVVTRINMELGSVEMDHEDIPGLMPPMRMEFFVSDKKMIEGLKAGDRIDFTIRYKDRNETIVKLSKAK